MKKDAWCKRQQTILFGLLTFVLLFFLTINFLTPVIGEDFVLSVLPRNENFHSVGDFLWSVAARIYDQMTGWNVRLGEQLSIAFSCLSKPIFNVLNSLIALYYLWLVCRYAFKWKAAGGDILWGIGVAFAAVITFQPALGEVFFWRTGSANYLWALCILLTFALPMRYYLSRESLDVISGSKIRLIGLTVLGFFAGFTNENTVGAIVLLYVGVFLYQKSQRKKLPLWVYTSFCSLLAGFLFMLLAPSTAHRSAFYNQMFGISEPGLRLYLSRIPAVILRFFKDNCALVLLTLGCLFLSALAWKRVKARGEAETCSIPGCLEPLGWLLLTAISCGALIISPYIETRAFLFSDFMMVVCIVYYSRVAITCLGWQRLFCLAETAILVACAPCAAEIYHAYREYGAFCDRRIAAVELCREEPFMWGEYAGPYFGRILTTREDYLYLGDRSGTLSQYFQKNVHVVPRYIWNDDLRIDGYTKIGEHQGGIDWVDYNSDNNTVTIGGWLALSGSRPEETETYAYLRNGEQLWYYATQTDLRPDVAKALGDEDMAASGFQGGMQLLNEAMECQELTYGAVVIDRGAKRYCEAVGGTVALH